MTVKTIFAYLLLSLALLWGLHEACAQKPEGYYLNAVNSLNAGNIDQAFGELNKALDLDSEHPQSRILRAYLFLQAGDKRAALDDYTAALRSAPTDLGALTNRALIYMEMEKYPEAEKDLKKRLKHDPYNWMAIYDLAYCYGLMQEHDKAIEGFTEVIKRKKDYPDAFLNRAYALYNKHSNAGLSEPAEDIIIELCADIERALELGHEDAERALEKYCGP